MTYGKSVNRVRPQTSKRSSAYVSRGSSARKAAFARARSAPAKPSTVKKNAQAIKQLKINSYGPLQKQITAFGDGQVVIANQPLCFQLNNPGHALYGPQVLRAHLSADQRVDKATDFSLCQDNLVSDMQDHQPNGPKCWIKYVQLRFRVSGFVDCTRVKFQIVKQRRIPYNLWDQHSGNNFMPALLPAFANTVGFTAHKVNRKLFQVLQEKTIYMNSRASSNALDTAEDRETTEATTPPVKLVNMFVPINKAFKQLDTSTDEFPLNEEAEMNPNNEDGNLSKGSYAFDNQHPYDNLWCVITTDDESSVATIATGDRVLVDCFRTIVWRDPVSSTRDDR